MMFRADQFAILFFVVATSALEYNCVSSKNFITHVPYSQISLTDYCDANRVCDSNPKYGPKNCPRKALRYCKTKCDEQQNCVGIFFQKLMNGHEICGFYHGSDSTSVMRSSAARWVHHNLRYGAVCEVVDVPDQTPEVFHAKAVPATTNAKAAPVAPAVALVPTPETAHIIQATIRLAVAVQTNGAFEFAFQSIVAHAAGHVCGAKSNEVCPANAIVLTSFQGTSITFHLKVANGEIATQAVANMKSTMEDGSLVSTQLAAAGVTDIDTFKNIFFGDVEITPTESHTAKDAKHRHGHAAVAWHRVARMLRCPKMWASLICVSLILAALVSCCKKMNNRSIRLAEEPVEALVIEPTTYAIVKDETSKEQV